MASLNLSSNGPSIQKAYQNVVSSTLLSGAPATHAQWAVYSVSAPLVNAFQPDGGNKESTLKVQSTGEGELVDLIEEFMDGRVQFAFLKVKDPNSGLPKSILIAWCGQGVPERVKGYFPNHLAAVAKTLYGYHVQITARSESDLSPDLILQKVSDASGSKYAGAPATSVSSQPIPPSTSSRSAFLPTQSSGGARSGGRQLPGMGPQEVDKDGWGADAPPITRTQLEKVPSAYQSTRVSLNGGPDASTRPQTTTSNVDKSREGIIGGGYQPVGKIDIAEIRKRAQEGGKTTDDRPHIVKGAYEPVGKVDIAALRAKSKGSSQSDPQEERQPSPAAQPASRPTQQLPSTDSERLTTMPKPKVGGSFGQKAAFSGTRAPQPAAFGLKPDAPPPPISGSASRTFADSSGKTPAQLWAENKAKAGGNSISPGLASPGVSAGALQDQKSGGEWKSGYVGKKWNSVDTNKTGRSATSAEGENDEEITDKGEVAPATGGIGALRDQFQATALAAPQPPPVNIASRPSQTSRAEQTGSTTAGLAPPAQPPRSPSPPTPTLSRDSSPVRIAMPVSRTAAVALEPPGDFASPPVPMESLSRVADREPESAVQDEDPDLGRGAAQHIAAAEPTLPPVSKTASSAATSKKQAVAQYDYDAAEDNEISLKEGETITEIDMVDESWWLGQNAQGQRGLFPATYVELEDAPTASTAAAPSGHQTTQHVKTPAATSAPAAAAPKGATATALYDYEAAEDNELSFEEGATITGVVSSTFFSGPPLTLLTIDRNSPIPTGGLAIITAKKGSSQPTTCSWTNEITTQDALSDRRAKCRGSLSLGT